jgi:hypothetical protein
VGVDGLTECDRASRTDRLKAVPALGLPAVESAVTLVSQRASLRDGGLLPTGWLVGAHRLEAVRTCPSVVRVHLRPVDGVPHMPSRHRVWFATAAVPQRSSDTPTRCSDARQPFTFRASELTSFRASSTLVVSTSVGSGCLTVPERGSCATVPRRDDAVFDAMRRPSGRVMVSGICLRMAHVAVFAAFNDPCPQVCPLDRCAEEVLDGIRHDHGSTSLTGCPNGRLVRIARRTIGGPAPAQDRAQTRALFQSMGSEPDSSTTSASDDQRG